MECASKANVAWSAAPVCKSVHHQERGGWGRSSGTPHERGASEERWPEKVGGAGEMMTAWSLGKKALERGSG